MNILESLPFRAARAPQFAPGPVWNVGLLPSVPETSDFPAPATLSDNVKFQFALNTCSGCHLEETNTSFSHVDFNSTPGLPARLSGFLIGDGEGGPFHVSDPRKPGITRSFNDLARRVIDLDNVANMSCGASNRNNLVKSLSVPLGVFTTH